MNEDPKIKNKKLIILCPYKNTISLILVNAN